MLSKNFSQPLSIKLAPAPSKSWRRDNLGFQVGIFIVLLGRRGSRGFRRGFFAARLDRSRRRWNCFPVPARGHGAHVVEKSLGQNHEHMAQHEEKKAEGEDEMNRARRLASAEGRGQPVEG